MKDIYAAYLQKEHEYYFKKAKYERLRNEYERKLAKLENKSPSWVKEVVTALAEKISEKLGGISFEIYGPFGLGCETSIYLFPNGGDNIVKNDTWGITLHPRFEWTPYDSELHEIRNFYLTYNTGETKNDFAPGTIGYLNGFNNVEAPLPESIDEIIKLLNFCKGREE